jgi:uncharacterized protein
MNTTTEKIFGSRLRSKILGWLFTHPDEAFFVRQIAVILKEDATNLSREMSKLEGLGILTSKRSGNLKLFQAKRDCFFFEELKNLVLKTSGVAGQLRASLNRISGVEAALIYGSYARGEEKADSDVDLLIVGDVDMDRLDSGLAKLEKEIGREINHVLYSREELESKRKNNDGFLEAVLGGKKIMLIGAENGFKAS